MEKQQSRKIGRPFKIQSVDDATGFRKVRLKLGLTQAEMAQTLICSVSSVQRYESQNTLPEYGALRAQFEKLARKAGISLKESA